MSQFGAYCEAVGAEIAARVQRCAEPWEAFPELAYETLVSIPRPSVSFEDVVEWALERTQLPRQVNFHSGFGQPPLIVYEAPLFYIELLIWFPSRTGIHGHGFTGAFTVMQGHSLQAEFTFDDSEPAGAGTRYGVLTPTSIDLIGPGAVHKIAKSDSFIHTVAHLGDPSLTLVVRTYGLKDVNQYTFLRSGFAAQTGWGSQNVTRKAQILGSLLASDSNAFGAMLSKGLETADDFQFYWILDHLGNNVGYSDFVQRILPLLERKFGELRHRPMAAMREGLRTRHMWSKIKATSNRAHQVELVLMELFPDAAECDAVFQRAGSGKSTRATIEEWKRQMVDAK